MQNVLELFYYKPQNEASIETEVHYWPSGRLLFRRLINFNSYSLVTCIKPKKKKKSHILLINQVLLVFKITPNFHFHILI